MVVRQSFVTNSSSSSFVTIDLESNELKKILQELEDEIDTPCSILFSDDDNVSIFLDEVCCDNPSSLENAIYVIAGLFDYEFYDDYLGAGEDGSIDLSNYPEVVRRIIEEKEEILKNLKKLEIRNGLSGWQGDDLSRYDRDWYEKEDLACIDERIMAELGYDSPDEITEEDFNEYVSDKVSTDEYVTMFNVQDGTFKTYRSTSVE